MLLVGKTKFVMHFCRQKTLRVLEYFQDAATALCFVAITALPISLSAQTTASGYGLGAVLDADVYASVPKTAPLARGDYLSAPPAMSLKAFVPPPGQQGQQGSCVGWATAYAARTVLKAKDNGADNLAKLREMALSPAYVYNQISLPGCNGSYIPDALELMQQQGVARLSEFPYDETSCARKPGSDLRTLATSHRIKGFTRLWGQSGRNKHVAVRRALANGNPVVIGMLVGNSISDHFGSASYMPTRNEFAWLGDRQYAFENELLFGHAMAVIGYDDARDGGAFEIVNSWGRDWGDDGFFWVSYEVFNAFVSEGYEVLPLDPPPPPRVVDMAGSIRLLHISGDELTARPQDSAEYRLTRSLPSGTRFRVEASSEKAGFVYVIGGDATGDYVALFPRGNDVSPHAAAGATLLLPGPTEAHFTRLNDTVGTDFYMVLFAQNPLDPQALAQEMAAGRGEPLERLEGALGDRLVDMDAIELDTAGIRFEAESGAADVVAIPIVIDHVAPNAANSDRTAPLIVLTRPAQESFDAATDPDAPIPVSSRFFQLEGAAQDESAIANLQVVGALSSQYSSRGPFRAEVELPPGPGPHEIEVVTSDVEGNSARQVFRFSLNAEN